MQTNFWHQLWADNEIGFHETKPNRLLVAYFEKLNLQAGSRVFLPLCGKTLDIAWLLSQRVHVLGAELSETAVKQLFGDLGIDEPTITSCGALTRHSAQNIDIYVGDIFDLSAEQLGAVDAIYDRAALVALPEPVRSQYTQHLVEITKSASQLLTTFDYEQNQMDGPPFSINADKVRSYYSNTYSVTPLESKTVPGKLKGKCAAEEQIWLLHKEA
jgi:thiopurine S-methyltransferase